MAGKEELLRDVAKAEALLSGLDAEREHVQARLTELRAALTALGQAEPGIRVQLPGTPPRPVPGSPEEKVGLFRQLFRGRGDVFPTRFVSRKTGKPGYAPACTNKFPELAVRELLVNALIHQDFFVTGAGPTVEIFADRFEITNPGRPLVDTQRFVDTPPRSRNEALASADAAIPDL